MENNDKKEKIIKSALNLFCEKGFAETDIDSVAKDAGVGKGTVYLYFKDKRDLFVSSTAFALNFFNDELEKSVKEGKDSKEKIEMYIDHSLSILTSNKNITRLFISEVLEAMRKCGGKNRLFDHSIFMRRFTLLKGILDSGIEKGEFEPVDRDSMAVMIMGGIHMIMTKYMVFSEKVNKRELSAFRESVIRLISKEK